MGNKQGSLNNHLETASKTGALAFPGKKLEEFPEALQKVSGNLRNLDLSNNKITSIPRWIANFKSLKTLNLSGNQLNGLPEEIGQLVKLENLIISKNGLSGALPKSLGKLKNLKVTFLQSITCHCFVQTDGTKFHKLPFCFLTPHKVYN